MGPGGGPRGEISGWRGVAVVLACLGLALRVLIPAGFMAAPTGSPLPLVLCTGHGPMTLAAGALPGADQSPAKAPSDKHAGDHCVFAGHGAPALAPLFAPVRPTALAAIETRRLLPLGLAPGRGLAAPPPPATGPPLKS